MIRMTTKKWQTIRFRFSLTLSYSSIYLLPLVSICVPFIFRANYWVSQKRRFCEDCKCWIADHPTVTTSRKELTGRGGMPLMD
jgi:hypothetical protein